MGVFFFERLIIQPKTNRFMKKNTRKNNELKEHMQGFCLKCPHRPSCTSPCPPVIKYVERGRRSFDRELDRIIIVYPPSCETHFTDLKHSGRELDQGYEPDPEVADFWGRVDVEKKLTGIFVDRFFNGWSWPDLAEKYDCSEQTAQAKYQQAKARLLEVLAAMDQNKPRRLDQMQRKTGRFNARVKAFLLAKCLDWGVDEIAEFLGQGASTVSKSIKICSDRVRTGEPVLVFEGEDLKGRGANLAEVRNHV